MGQNTGKIIVFINGKKRSIPPNCTINEMLKTFLNIDEPSTSSKRFETQNRFTVSAPLMFQSDF